MATSKKDARDEHASEESLLRRILPVAGLAITVVGPLAAAAAGAARMRAERERPRRPPLAMVPVALLAILVGAAAWRSRERIATTALDALEGIGDDGVLEGAPTLEHEPWESGLGSDPLPA